VKHIPHARATPAMIATGSRGTDRGRNGTVANTMKLAAM